MTREIKFRVWAKEQKKMTQAESLFIDNYYSNADGTVVNEWFANPKMIFMQFTGLLDKNGKEIYEGDVVREYFKHWNKVRLTIVKWNESCGWWEVPREEQDGSPKDEKEYEIIGNIYENPNLLEDDTERPDYNDSSGNEYNDYQNSEIRELNAK